MRQSIAYPNNQPLSDWTRDLPNHWAAKRLKFCLKTALAYGANEAAEEADPDEPRFIRITDLSDDGSLRPDTFKSIEAGKAGPYLLTEGDILLARSGATVGKSFLYRRAMGLAAYAGYLIRARLGSELVPQFLQYFFQSNIYRQWIQSIFIQATIQNISAEKYANLVVPVPSREDQQRLLMFLDRETARIDALICRKRRLLELLEEKRLAVITHAVTKGLDPNAPMKDSGIAWLGQIPAHWDVMAFNRGCLIVGGQVDPKEEPYSEMPLIAPDHIESGTGLLLETASAAEQGAISGKYLFRAGDILYSKIRPELRKMCIAEFDGLCSADMYAIRHPEFIDTSYLFYLLLSKYHHQYAVLESMRVAMPKVNRESLSAFQILVPPKAEQRQISAFIAGELTKLERMRRVQQTIIARLQEYRSALITNAVTGKIDVRGAVERKEAAE